MPELSAPAQIVLSTQHGGKRPCQPVSKLASAQILENLLPGLFCSNNLYRHKNEQVLSNVDNYMQQETGLLCQRLEQLCKELEIDNNSAFKISQQNARFVVTGNFSQCHQLCKKLNNDTCFISAFNWLQPNYVLLAHSVEILEFSYAYQQSRECAIKRYNHFEHLDNGLKFNLEHIKGKVAAVLESPLNIYIIEHCKTA